LPIEGEVFLLTSDGKAKRIEPKEFPSQGRYGKGVSVWNLSEKIKLVGILAGKPNEVATIHMSKGAAKSARLDAAAIRKRAAKFERRILWRNVREYTASAIAAALLAYFLVTAHDLLSQVTFGLFIAAMVWIVVQLHRKGSVKTMPAGADTQTSLQFYRTELERQREAVSSVWSWYLAPLVPGFLVYTVGYAIKFPRPAAWARPALMDAVIAVAFYVVWKMNARAARCLQRMIDELNATENPR
jgi:hypothetical protein